MEKLKYPIGRFKLKKNITPEIINQCIKDIEKFPGKLNNEVEHLTDKQLNTNYRPDGWSIRQVVHHCADSHLNAFTRFKLAITENEPIVKPYIEEKWAELLDATKAPIKPSLQIIEGLHFRWVVLLKTLSEIDMDRHIIHPENNTKYKLKEILCLYAWHCNHHLKHIINLKQQEKWA